MTTTPETLLEQAAELPSLPDIYLRVKTVVEDSNSSMNDVASVVATDPAIAARLLKLANSAFFGLRARVDTLGRAVSLIGTRQIQDLVLATTVADAFAEVTTTNFSQRSFWLGSVHAALLAQAASRTCELADHERHFVTGLLHDLGHLVIDQAAPETLAAAFAQAEADGSPRHLAERALLGFDAAAVGAALLAQWQLPPNLVAAIRAQRSPADAPAPALDAAIIHLALTVLDAQRDGSALDDVYQRLDPVALDLTGVTAEQLTDIGDAAAAALAETFELLFPELPRNG